MNNDLKDIENFLREEFQNKKANSQNIQVPKNAKNKILEGIEKGEKLYNLKNKEIKLEENSNIKTRSKIMNINKKTKIAVASIIMVIGLANINENVSYGMQSIPVLGKVFKAFTFREFKMDKDNYFLDAKIPNISGDTNAVKSINTSINEKADELIKEFKSNYEKNNKEGHEALNITYDVLSDTENYYSIVLKILQTNASSYEQDKYYTIDKNSGKEIQLKDLFKENVNYVDQLNKILIDHMKLKMKQDDSLHYFLDDEIEDSNFKSIKDNQNFYLDNNDNLHICFDQYEIAPGYMGAQDFEISKNLISNILK